MLQNPPSSARDTPRRSGRRFGEYGLASRHGPSYGTRGQCPDNLQTNVARNFPRSLFEITRKRCNSNDVDSTFELIARELRATLMGGGKAWPSIETTLVVDEVVHPIGKSQPQLIGGNAPSRVECSRSGGIFTMGRILSEELRRGHASPTTPPSTIPGTEPRPTRLVL